MSSISISVSASPPPPKHKGRPCFLHGRPLCFWVARGRPAHTTASKTDASISRTVSISCSQFHRFHSGITARPIRSSTMAALSTHHKAAVSRISIRSSSSCPLPGREGPRPHPRRILFYTIPYPMKRCQRIRSAFLRRQPCGSFCPSPSAEMRAPGVRAHTLFRGGRRRPAGVPIRRGGSRLLSPLHPSAREALSTALLILPTAM